MALPWAYFDTSVLVKRYVGEQSSRRARAVLRRHRILSSVLAPVEAISALARRRAAGELPVRDFDAILERLNKDRAYWNLVEVSDPVLDLAERLVSEGTLRTLDALHLASAVLIGMRFARLLPFVTADEAQKSGAEALGLEVLWVA